MKLVGKLIEEGKLEDGVSAWSSPSFPVPKKKPGEYRFVVDYRAVNDATVTDAHPLPRIEDILQRQGRFKVWSVLDMKDGYHQVPLKKEHPRPRNFWSPLLYRSLRAFIRIPGGAGIRKAGPQPTGIGS